MHDIALGVKVLARNEEIAAGNRKELKDKGIAAVNIISAPGSGKTSIVERTVELLKGGLNIAVIEGDIQTDLDAVRISRHGVPVMQINTGRSCHLDAHMIEHALSWLFEQGKTDLLIIENVGNMVCPAEYDLGEDLKVAVMSVTEGEDKPLKYPSLFSSARYLLINKVDLMKYTSFDIVKAEENALSINPKLKIFRTSCVDGTGLDEWTKELQALAGYKFGHCGEIF